MDKVGASENGHSLPSMPTNGQGRSRFVAVIGCGHVGAVTAACLARLGHRVVGVDLQDALVQRLNAGQPPFWEPGLPELIQEGIAENRLSFTTSYEAALDRAEFIFLSVNTPASETGAANLRYFNAAVSKIGHVVNGTNPIIITKSTLPVGTAETIKDILAEVCADEMMPPRVVANPEFLRQGNAVVDFLIPSRIVVGSNHPEDAEEVLSLYQAIDAPVVNTDLQTAEMIKYASNCFLATKISFINEVARICESSGANIDQVVEGMSHDGRIEPAFLAAGIGFGGSCLPKDVAALCNTGETLGLVTPLLSAVQQVNITQREHAINRMKNLLGTLDQTVVAVWGVTFKGGTEDLRDSPAQDVIQLLRREGAVLQIYDPALQNNYHDGYDFAGTICSTPLEAAQGAALLAILTDWEEFGRVDLGSVASVMTRQLVFDGRNVLSLADVAAAGFTYCGVGRPLVSNSEMLEVPK